MQICEGKVWLCVSHILSSPCVVRNPTYIPADVNGGKEIHKTLAKDWTKGKKKEEKGERVRKLPAIPRGSAGLFKRIQLWEMALLKVTFRIDIIVETPPGLSQLLPILGRNFPRAFAEEDRIGLAAFDM